MTLIIFEAIGSQRDSDRDRGITWVVRVHCSKLLRCACGCVTTSRVAIEILVGPAKLLGGGFGGFYFLPLFGKETYAFFHPFADFFQDALQAKVL